MLGSCSGRFYALDSASGMPRWSYDTRQDVEEAGPAQFHGDPLVLGDQVVTGSDTARPSFMVADSSSPAARAASPS